MSIQSTYRTIPENFAYGISITWIRSKDANNEKYALSSAVQMIKTNCFRDLVPIISALEYNTWFTKLRTSHIKLTHEAIERLLHIMKKSLSLEELYLDNLGFKW